MFRHVLRSGREAGFEGSENLKFFIDVFQNTYTY